MIIAILIAVLITMVVAIGRYRVHPFLALIVASYVLGLCGGLSSQETMTVITTGFGKTISQIGIIIACGCIIGAVLEKSGCAIMMAEAAVSVIGRARSVIAMSFTGALVSIPVFCDSGYVVLTPVMRSLAVAVNKSMSSFVVALGMGLYVTHCLVPPTPGPVAAANELGADLGSVIVLGGVTVVPVILATYLYAIFVGRRIIVRPKQPDVGDENTTISQTYSIRRTLVTFVPILVPIVLIALKSFARQPTETPDNNTFNSIMDMAGDPNSALMIGVLLAGFVVYPHGLKMFGAWCSDGLRNAGTIILITAAGGALGAVLRVTPVADIIIENVIGMNFGRLKILLPFLVSAAFKTSIGSSTVAIITASSLMAPLLVSMGLSDGLGPVLVAIAITTGSMFVSHVNDSYFWVVTQMSGLSVSQGYRLVTIPSAIAGIVGMLVVSIIYLSVY